MRRSITFILIIALLVTPAAPAMAAAVDPSFDTTVPEPVVVPGQTQQVTIQVANDAGPDDRAETASDVRATVAGGDTPVDVQSGPRRLGTMADGDVRTVSVTVDVPANVDAGTYRLPVTVTYEHDGETKTETVHATVRVEDRAHFRVESTTSSVAVGSTGTVSVTMTNVGSEAATDAAVTLSSTHSDVRFGQGASASRFAGAWAPNETKTLTYEVAVADTAEPLAYALNAQVAYDTPGGDTRQSRPLRVGVTPLPEQSFAVKQVESTLRVGDEGTLTGTVVNTGEQTVRNVVVTVEPTSPNVNAVETEVAVGTLQPGESKRFSFDIAVSESAGAGPRQFSLGVQYRNRKGDRRQSEPLGVRVTVGSKRPTFAVSPVDASFSVGSSGALQLELTNRGEKRLTDVSAKLYASSPLSSSDDEAFVETLNAGQTVTLTFGLGVGSGAMAKTYPVKLDFRYDTPDGDTRVSDTYQVPVEVTESDRGGLPLPLVGGVVLVLLVLAGAGYYVRTH